MRRTTDWSTCLRVAGAIESANTALAATAKEFEAASDDAAREAAEALRAAEAAMSRARTAVQLALSRQTNLRRAA